MVAVIDTIRWRSAEEAFSCLKARGITDIIFDCDGVLWLGDEAIAGAAEALKQLQNYNLYFLTNHSSKSSAYLADRLCRLFGIQTSENYAFSSAKLAALTALNLLKPGDSVHVVGDLGLKVEFKRYWIDYESEESVKAVVVGYDEEFDFRKLHRAAQHLRNRPECAFIACSLDGQYPRSDCILPGTGALVAAIAKAADRVPVLVGKPSPLAFQVMQQVHPHLDPRSCLMVGDRLSSDIAFGKARGMHTLLVETGIPEERGSVIPDFVASSIAIFNERKEVN